MTSESDDEDNVISIVDTDSSSTSSLESKVGITEVDTQLCRQYLLSDSIVKYTGYQLSTCDVETVGKYAMLLVYANDLFDHPKLSDQKDYKNVCKDSIKPKNILDACRNFSVNRFEIREHRSQQPMNVIFNLAFLVYMNRGMESLLELAHLLKPRIVSLYAKQNGFLSMLNRDDSSIDTDEWAKLDDVETAIDFKFNNRVLAYNAVSVMIE